MLTGVAIFADGVAERRVDGVLVERWQARQPFEGHWSSLAEFTGGEFLVINEGNWNVLIEVPARLVDAVRSRIDDWCPAYVRARVEAFVENEAALKLPGPGADA